MFFVPAKCTLLSISFFNPTPYEAWCSVGAYPWNCLALDGIECIRGDKASAGYISIVVLCTSLLIAVAFIVVLVCMSIIIYGAHKKGDKADENWNALKRALVQQSLMYIMAFLLIWIFRFAALFTPNTAIQLLRLTTLNLQGLLNAFIFMYHKVHNLMRKEPSFTVLKSLYLIIIKPAHVPEIKLAGLSIIANDNKPDSDRKSDLPFIEEGIEDASKDMHLSFARSEEVSYMFDCEISPKLTTAAQESGNKNFEGSQFSESRGQDNERAQDVFHDSDVSFSNDASTIKARNW